MSILGAVPYILAALVVQDAAAERPLKGFVVADHLWVRTMRGLWSVSLTDGSATERLHEGVLDVTRATNGDLWLLRRLSRERPDQVDVQRVHGERLEPWLTVAIPRETLVLALLEYRGRPLILTSATVLRAEEKAWSELRLRTPICNRGCLGYPSAVLTRDERFLFVGTNGGEFGGQFLTIDLANGKVENRASKSAITGIVADLQHRDCVLVATGLAHLMTPVGELVRACAGSLKETAVIDPKTFGREALFGLDVDRTGYWAVTFGAVYHITNDQTERLKIPSGQTLGPLGISRSIKGIVLFRTNLNQAASLSGPTPLLAVDTR